MSELPTNEPKQCILKWIEPRNFGPFSVPKRLNLDPRVTVLTAPNDTGKSALLRALRLLLTGEMVDENDVNGERLDAYSGKWQDDPEVGCEACFPVSQRTIDKREMKGDVKLNDEVVVFSRFTANAKNHTLRHIVRDGTTINTTMSFRTPPRALTLPLASEIKEVVDLANLTGAEEKLLKLGFGSGFSLAQHQALQVGKRNIQVSKAQTRLNEKLKQILPPKLKLEIRLHEIAGHPAGLSIALVDPLFNHVPIGSRGTGVRRMLGLMGDLLTVTDSNQPTIILIDEPENSLHADAQHSLRRLLERLADSPLIQVVYATHSPSMINTMRPTSIRVLERCMEDGKPCSIVRNDAYGSNFTRVRASLGLTPADSLLFGPVTIVVEGPTEVRCLPIIYERLCREKVTGFGDAEELLSLVHFLDGTGDNYEYMTRLAKSQNAKPIIFLDGDKRGYLKKVEQMHPEVPLILLDNGQEFENLVPIDVYIAGIKSVHGGHEGITREAFEAWQQGKSFKPSLMLSKRVQRWLEDEFEIEPKKPLIMEHAISNVAINQLDVRALKELIEAMRSLLNSL